MYNGLSIQYVGRNLELLTWVDKTFESSGAKFKDKQLQHKKLQMNLMV
jgi:hypothetical protein